MEETWQKACTYYDVPEDVSKTWFARLQRQMSEPKDTRSYHNWQEMMQGKYEYLQALPAMVILAAYFQYYHYDGNRSCVKENCHAFKEFCKDAQFANVEDKAVILKLLGDKRDEGELTTCYENSAEQLQDLDLAILAASPERYKKYTTLLRQEYSHMNDESYKAMRLKVLQTLLMIPNIYLTADFQAKCEAAARLNIEDEISELKQ